MAAALVVAPDVGGALPASVVRGEAAFAPRCRRPKSSRQRLPDDCSRYARSVTAQHHVIGPTVLNGFRQAVATHGTLSSIYATHPKASPASSREHDTHDHVGTDTSDEAGIVTFLVQDHDIRIVDPCAGELLRHLTLDPTRDYQPTGAPKGPKPKTKQPEP